LKNLDFTLKWKQNGPFSQNGLNCINIAELWLHLL